MSKLKGDDFRFCLRKGDTYSHVYTIRSYNGEVMVCDDSKGGPHITIHKSGEVHWGPQRLSQFGMSPRDRHNIQSGLCPDKNGRKILNIVLPTECATALAEPRRKDKLQVIDITDSPFGCVVITFVETLGVDELVICGPESKLLGRIAHKDGRILSVVYFQTNNYIENLIKIDTYIKATQHKATKLVTSDIASNIAGGVATIEINGVFGFVDMRGVNYVKLVDDGNDAYVDIYGNILEMPDINLHEDYRPK